MTLPAFIRRLHPANLRLEAALRARKADAAQYRKRRAAAILGVERRKMRQNVAV